MIVERQVNLNNSTKQEKNYNKFGPIKMRLNSVYTKIKYVMKLMDSKMACVRLILRLHLIKYT